MTGDCLHAGEILRRMLPGSARTAQEINNSRAWWRVLVSTTDGIDFILAYGTLSREDAERFADELNASDQCKGGTP